MKLTRERIFDMLTSPRSTSEIAAELAISRQAVYQHLRGLIAEGRVRSIRRQRGVQRVWYCRTAGDLDSSYKIIPERFDGASNRLLRKLQADAIYGMDQLAKILRTDPPHVTLTVNKLVMDGHLWTIKVAGRRLCLLTGQGSHYGYEIGRHDKASADPITPLIGDRRSAVLLALRRQSDSSLGDLRAVSVVLGMSSDIQILKVIKSLRNDGLLIISNGEYPRRYSLSPMGTLLAMYVHQQG